MIRATQLLICYLTLCWLPASILAQSKIEQPSEQGSTQAPAPGAKPAAKQVNAPATPSDAETLAAAYKREFAFLAEQKRELNNRLREFRARSGQTEQSLRQRISMLERENLSQANQEDNLRTQLTAAEHKEESLHERSELLEMTYSQANSTLKKYQRALEKQAAFVDGGEDGKLSLVFATAHDLLKDLSAVRKTRDKFFLLDGTETDGQIIHIGNIAAYGVSNQGSGILVPAGNNRYRIWAEPAADIAEGLLNGNRPPLLKMYLYESRERAIDITTEKSVMEIIDSGGLIGWVIVVLGLLVVILVVVRTVILYSKNAQARAIRIETLRLLADQQVEQALNYCQRQTGPFARLLAAIMTHAKAERDHLEDVISETLLHESAPLNRFGATILVIATISPLLGLLGTVTGMISTFDIITEFGTGDPKLLSGGISIALVTTQLGLIVAIPAVLVATMLNSWAETIKRELEETALKASNLVLGNVPQAIPAASPDISRQTDQDALAGGAMGYSAV